MLQASVTFAAIAQGLGVKNALSTFRAQLGGGGGAGVGDGASMASLRDLIHQTILTDEDRAALRQH